MSATTAKDLDRSQREPLVANPSDPSRAQKEAAIRSKLRTYEALLAMKEGYMPSTEQITAWARYALRDSGVLDSRNRRLSVQGRGFVRDLRAWVEAVVEVGLGKNVSDVLSFGFLGAFANVKGGGNSRMIRFRSLFGILRTRGLMFVGQI
ncbi:hypothetical protein HOY82DRAFT_304307 [Tuber indicum]|nr:hypothetical protein HOY82DRAFT_304307 [Tuber indicum]